MESYYDNDDQQSYLDWANRDSIYGVESKDPLQLLIEAEEAED